MTKPSYQQLITQLSDDLDAQQPLNTNSLWLAGKLCVVSMALVALIMFSMQEFRPEWWQQIVTSPRFLLEMGSGLLMILCFIYAMLQSSIPGRSSVSFGLGIVCGLTWLLTIASGIIEPVFDVSMASKRHRCYLEALLYSLPLMLLFGITAYRRYSTRPLLTAGLISCGASMIPAYMMQIACMYGVYHALHHHILPAVIISIIATPLLAIILRRR